MSVALGWSSSLRVACALLALPACAPKLVVGDFSCTAGADAAIPDKTAPVTAPWSTSFEGKDCEYRQAAGFCFTDPEATMEVVTSPVHSGRYAMAFHVGENDGGNDSQARCVRQGVLPTAAYYGAWYYVPALAINNNKVWNLFHFQIGDPNTQKGLWDLSLLNDQNQDDLELIGYDFLTSKVYPDPSRRIPIPIGSWFHLELFLKRASDMTGEAALYQDGVQLFDVTGIQTDTNSTFQQWYAGNLSTGLLPPDNIVYMDDVTIAEAL